MKVALDIETNMSHDKIWLCVTQEIDTGVVKVWKNPNGLNDYLEKATLIVAQNGIAFDFPILNRLWKTNITRKKVYDTLVVSRLLDPTREKGHSLEAWGEELGEAKLNYKAVWTWLEGRDETYPGECFDNPHSGLLEHYCVRDVAVLCALFHRLQRDCASKEFSDESVELEHQVASIIAQQERNGFKLDIQHATLLLANLKGKMADIDDQMQKRWPPIVNERYSEKTGKRLKDEIVVFNPGSRKQIGEKLQELGWKPKKFTETGIPQVDEAILEQIIKECEK